jgi:hypothetical protein
MGLDLVQAAAMGNLQCDLELEFMVMTMGGESELETMDIFFSIFARPNLMMRAIVTLQLRHRYRMWLAMRVRRLAVAMALHPRLGKESGGLRMLDIDMLRLIISFSQR